MWGLPVHIFTCLLARLCCVETFHVDVGTPVDSPDSTYKLITFWQVITKLGTDSKVNRYAGHTSFRLSISTTREDKNSIRSSCKTIPTYLFKISSLYLLNIPTMMAPWQSLTHSMFLMIPFSLACLSCPTSYCRYACHHQSGIISWQWSSDWCSPTNTLVCISLIGVVYYNIWDCP